LRLQGVCRRDRSFTAEARRDPSLPALRRNQSWVELNAEPIVETAVSRSERRCSHVIAGGLALPRAAGTSCWKRSIRPDGSQSIREEMPREWRATLQESGLRACREIVEIPVIEKVTQNQRTLRRRRAIQTRSNRSSDMTSQQVRKEAAICLESNCSIPTSQVISRASSLDRSMLE